MVELPVATMGEPTMQRSIASSSRRPGVFLPRSLLAGFAVVAGFCVALAGLSSCDKGASGSPAMRSLLAEMPASSPIVGGVAVGKIRQSALFKKYQDQLLSRLPRQLVEIKETCGIDVINDIETVVVSVGEDPNDRSQQLYAVQGNFDEEKIASCLRTMVKKLDPGAPEVVIEKKGKITAYSDGKGRALHVYWPDSKTAVIAPEVIADLDALGRLIEGPRLSDNKEVMEMVGKVDMGAALWTAGRIPPGAVGNLGMMASMAPRQLHVAIDVGSEVTARIGLRFEKDDQASGLAGLAKLGIGQLKAKPEAKEFADVLDAITFEPSGKDLIVKAKVTMEQVDRMVQKAMNQ